MDYKLRSPFSKIPFNHFAVSFSLLNLTHSTFFFNGYEKAVESRTGDVGNISKTEPRPFAADRPFLNKDLVLSLLSHNNDFSLPSPPRSIPYSPNYGTYIRSKDSLAIIPIATKPLGNGRLIISARNAVPFEYNHFRTQLIISR